MLMPDDLALKLKYSPALERNARTLVSIIAKTFPTGARCSELLLEFQNLTRRERQTFFNCFAFAKTRGWIVADGGIHTLNADGCWREAINPRPDRSKIGDEVDRSQFQHVLDQQVERIEKLEFENQQLLDEIADANGNVAVSSLVRIVGDDSIAIPRRLKAAAIVIGYRSDDGVTAFVKRFLQSLCSNADMHVDHRIEAGELLRRYESPKVTMGFERWRRAWTC
jgi:hypothetical protein